MFARAFTFGSHLYLGAKESISDLSLIAHEVAHVLQQAHVPAVQGWGLGPTDRYEQEAQRASQAAVAGVGYTVQAGLSAPRVQPLGLGDVLDALASLAANVPGYTLLTVVVGRNPINVRVVERSPASILRGFLGLVPGGEILYQVLSRFGIVERIGAWIVEQMGALGLNYDDLRNRFARFTESLSWREIFSPEDVWKRAEDLFEEPIKRLRTFVSRLIDQAIAWLRQTFTQPLSDLCRQMPGYTLVTVLLGKDPFTNAVVPRTAINMVTAFVEFIPGGTEVVSHLVESKGLEKAYVWLVQETRARNLTWERVAGTFASAWSSLKLEDVLHPIETLKRIGALLEPLLRDLVSFAGACLVKLLELVFEAAMGAGGVRVLALLKKGRDTFLTIVRDPVAFLGNLVGAVGKGVRQFMTRILEHLKEGVIAWLTGPVAKAGVKMPETWDLKGIIWFVLQILGLTWDRVRQKLVKLLGEPAVAAAEKGLELIRDIREKGIVQALKDQVVEFFGQLKEAALGSIKSFIQQRLVVAGITQLLSMLNPVGAIVQAIIKTYTTIQFFLDKINQILELVESIVDSIATIASGAIGAAANFVEKTMARTIPVILDFLARFIGLGNVGDHEAKTIHSLQARVDGMLDKLVDWIKNTVQGLVSRALGGDLKSGSAERVQNGLKEAVAVVNKYSGKKVGALLLRPLLVPIKLKYRLSVLEAFAQGGTWHVKAAASPEQQMATDVKVETDTNAPVRVGDVTATPTVAYQTKTLQIDKGSDTVGVSMTAEYLAPNHPQGSSPGDSEQAAIFTYLPTIGKVPEGSSRQGGAVYIKGHLLNDNLGGPGVEKNLFPISVQANSEHKTRIETKVKDIVNNQGLLAHYAVTVGYTAPEKVPGLVSKDGIQLYKIDATFTCLLGTYRKLPDNNLLAKNPPATVSITSTYTGGAAKSDSSKVDLALGNAAQMSGFKKEDVLWAPSRERR